MRILAAVNNFPWATHIEGIFNLRQLTALRELGHEVRVVRWTPWAPPLGARWRTYGRIPAAYTVEGISVRTMRVAIGPRNMGLGTLSAQFAARMRHEVETFAPDIVQVHGLIPAGTMALAARVPYVLTAHGTEAYKAPWVRPDVEQVARRVVAGASACAAVSQFVASHVQRLGAPHVDVIFNGADETVFAPADAGEARAALGFPREAPTIVFVGHVDVPKGVLELKEAVMALRDLEPHVVFAGRKYAAADSIERELGAAGIRATFLGVIDQKRLASVIAAADVCTLPSHAEGLPTALCEAMNVGRAIVASNVGGIPEIVHNGETGFTIAPGDALALAERLRIVLTDRALREAFEREASRFARLHLTWRANAERYDALFRTIVRSRRVAATTSANRR